jgi:redox-sensitive bicupin YhaK (pirin superfamily)
MNRPATVSRLESPELAFVPSAPRAIVLRSSGDQHGPIRRLVSPSDIGELIKPFVFLDHAVVAPRRGPLFGIHPHSGIATLTVVLRGGLNYEDTTGESGSVPTGGLEWMKAGNGVWHDGAPTPGEALRAFQLWIALPESDENAPPESQYIEPDAVQAAGPARVILGHYGRASSPIRAPAGINYLHVRLSAGQRWKYVPPRGHTVAWLAVDRGNLSSTERIDAGEIAVFDDSDGAIELQAYGETEFVLGSAIKHPFPLLSFWVTTQFTRAPRRSLKAKPRSSGSALGFAPKVVFEARPLSP